jgi:hypothetical protein
MALTDIIKGVADPRNITLFKSGAKGGNKILLALVDDLHEIACRFTNEQEMGMAKAVLFSFIPKATEAFEDYTRNAIKVYGEQFPNRPKEGVLYAALITKQITIGEDKKKGVSFQIDALNPVFYGILPLKKGQEVVLGETQVLKTSEGWEIYREKESVWTHPGYEESSELQDTNDEVEYLEIDPEAPSPNPDCSLNGVATDF